VHSNGFRNLGSLTAVRLILGQFMNISIFSGHFHGGFSCLKMLCDVGKTLSCLNKSSVGFFASLKFIPSLVFAEKAASKGYTYTGPAHQQPRPAHPAATACAAFLPIRSARVDSGQLTFQSRSQMPLQIPTLTNHSCHKRRTSPTSPHFRQDN